MATSLIGYIISKVPSTSDLRKKMKKILFLQVALFFIIYMKSKKCHLGLRDQLKKKEL